MRLPKRIIKALSKLDYADVSEPDNAGKYISVYPTGHYGWRCDDTDLWEAATAIKELIEWSKEKVNES